MWIRAPSIVGNVLKSQRNLGPKAAPAVVNTQAPVQHPRRSVFFLV